MRMVAEGRCAGCPSPPPTADAARALLADDNHEGRGFVTHVQSKWPTHEPAALITRSSCIRARRPAL
jgi:hypothetical protein